jgi:hypothetical protein
MATMNATKTGRIGGKTRSRNLSPERRREIARLAVQERIAKLRGELSVREVSNQVVLCLRSVDPDFAIVVRTMQSWPTRHQQRGTSLFSPQEKELLQRAWLQATAVVWVKQRAGK